MFCQVARVMGLSGCGAPFEQAQEQAFVEHVSKYGLNFATAAEYNFRFGLFVERDTVIQESNANPENTFTLGHNQFSHMTEQEYKKMLGYKGHAGEQAVEIQELPTADLPTSIDWRTKGAVNPVQNQGQCGSCWAFSATAALEGHNFIQTGNLVKLAEQQLVDCDTRSQGCNGGWQSWAYDYLEKNSQELESDYKYTARDGSCAYKASEGKIGVKTYKQVKPNDPNQLMAAVAQGPVAITVEADRSAFQSYTSGILNSKACGTQLDHAIVAVGYGTENNQDFWIVRNSWGASWGEQGYIRIARSSGAGICGINEKTLWPTAN